MPSEQPRAQAVIMAGGKGSRLYPYSAVLPKPLMPLGGMPVLELLLRQFRHHRIENVVLATNHLSHLIQSFFGDGSGWNLQVSYSREDRPLGTCGPIAAVLDRMAENFLVSNGDLLTNIDVGRLLAFHADHHADATVATFRRDMKLEFGVLDISPDHRVIEYREKPAFSYNVGMGLYVLRREAVRAYISKDKPMDMPMLLNQLIEAKRPVLSYQEDCLWLDIGSPDDYARAQTIMESNPSIFLPPEPPRS
jgi:NDP-sugar pyrophosphorylase family protein